MPEGNEIWEEVKQQMSPEQEEAAQKLADAVYRELQLVEQEPKELTWEKSVLNATNIKS